MELLANSVVAAAMMLWWITLAGHWQQQSIFMLNLQGEMYYIYLFIYYGSDLVLYLKFVLWGKAEKLIMMVDLRSVPKS